MDSAINLWNALAHKDPVALVRLGLELVGGIVGVLAFVLHGIQPAVLWLTPKAVNLAASFVSWLIGIPWLGDTIINNKAAVKSVVDAVIGGLKTILDAIDAEIDKDIDAAKATKSDPTPPAPKP